MQDATKGKKVAVQERATEINATDGAIVCVIGTRSGRIFYNSRENCGGDDRSRSTEIIGFLNSCFPACIHRATSLSTLKYKFRKDNSA